MVDPTKLISDSFLVEKLREQVQKVVDGLRKTKSPYGLEVVSGLNADSGPDSFEIYGVQ
jgi:hypothetical protein